MPPKTKKRKAAAADTPQAARDVFVLHSESEYDHHCHVQVIGCFGNWLDLKAKVEETMEQDAVALFENFEFCDEIEKSIHHDSLEEEWDYAHGLGVASISSDSDVCFRLMVHRTSLQ